MAFQYVIVKNSGRGRGYLPTIMPEASFSDAYIQEHGDRFEQLSKERQSCFTDDLIFNALMGIMGIHEPQLYEPQNDLTSKSYDSDLNRFVTLYGKRHISEDQ